MSIEEVLHSHGFEFEPEPDEDDEDFDPDLEPEYQFLCDYRGWHVGCCEGLTLIAPDRRVFVRTVAADDDLDEDELTVLAKDAIDEAIAAEAAASGQLDLFGGEA